MEPKDPLQSVSTVPDKSSAAQPDPGRPQNNIGPALGAGSVSVPAAQTDSDRGIDKALKRKIALAVTILSLAVVWSIWILFEIPLVKALAIFILGVFVIVLIGLFSGVGFF